MARIYWTRKDGSRGCILIEEAAFHDAFINIWLDPEVADVTSAFPNRSAVA